MLGRPTLGFWEDLAIESLVWLPYYVLFQASPWQATPGKRAFGIKVTDLEGRRIGYGRSLARYAASIVSFLALMIGYLMVPFTRKRQAMHDMIAGTLVIDANAAPGTVPADRTVMPLYARTFAAIATVSSLFLFYVWMTAFVMPSPEERDRITQGEPAGPNGGARYQLGYALYGFPYFGGEPRLIRQDTRSYGLDDVRVSPTPGWDDMRIEKRVPVTDGFTIVVQVHRQPVVAGIGIQLEKGPGLSWEWFAREEGGYTFRSPNGPGRFQARIDVIDGLEEVAEILFLEDTTLRLDRNYLVPFTAPATEQLVLRKGSVLALKAPVIEPDPPTENSAITKLESDPNYRFQVARSRFSSRE